MKAFEEKHYITDECGNRVGVVLSIELYEQLIEDLHDLAVVAERRDGASVSFDEVKHRLEIDGLL